MHGLHQTYDRLKWKLVLVCLVTVLILLQERCLILRRTYHKLRKSFWTHPTELLGDVGHAEPCFSVCLEIVLVSV
jgi:hypothetical protein